MVEGFGIKPLNKRDVVHDGRKVRQQFGEPDAGFAVLFELITRAEQGGVFADLREPDVLQDLIRHLLAVAFDQLGFVVEQVEVRRPAGLEQVNYVLGLRREVRAGCGCTDDVLGGRGKKFFVQQRTQRERAHARAALLQKLPARGAFQDFQIRSKHIQPFVSVSSRLSNTLATMVHAANLRISRLAGRSAAP